MDLNWLNSYQTLIVGAIGFAGVILTLRHNAKVAHDQRNKEREHEREALRVALVAELRINRRSLEENSRRLKEGSPRGEGGVFVPTDRMDGAYRSFLPRIGLLSEDEVSKVMEAYLSLETYNAKLFLVGLPVDTGHRHVHVPAKNARMLAAMQEGMLQPIDQAIKALGGVDNVH